MTTKTPNRNRRHQLASISSTAPTHESSEHGLSHFAFAMLVIVSLGCQTPCQSESDDAINKAIVNTFSFQRAYNINPARARWFVDGTDGRYTIIYVGFEEGTHYTRTATLRIRENGLVERQASNADGELIWIRDE